MKVKINVLFVILLLNSFLTSYAQDVKLSEVEEKNIQSRIENGTNAGIVIGIIDGKGIQYYSYGVKSMNTNEPVNEQSVFEIGSISKTFTGLLLADMVVRGEANLEDPLQQYLPEGINAPSRNGMEIKLFELSNHTSGLPRLPANMLSADLSNPYADYSEQQLYNFLNSYSLTRDIGSQYEYSNYAVGLLGHILAASKNTTYEDLLIDVIANPLGMTDTRIIFTPEMKMRLAIGHSRGKEVANWDIPTLAGAGAIRSTAVDMLKYIAANMGIQQSELYPAMLLTHKNTREDDAVPVVGLGWHKRSHDNIDIVWHNGGTGGYRTFAGFLKNGDRGVVVLSNSDVSVDDIGIHFLIPEIPLNEIKLSIATKLHNEIDSKGIDAGIEMYHQLKKTQKDKYDFNEDDLNNLGYEYLNIDDFEKAIAVFRLNVEEFPSSSNVYDSLGEAYMESGDNDKAVENYKKSVELNPGNEGGIERLKKLGVDISSIVGIFNVTADQLNAYVGNFELVPGFIITISVSDNQLMAQATGQSNFPVFPKSEDVFYYKVVEAQLTFNRDPDGNIESLTLLQGGQELTGKKVE